MVAVKPEALRLQFPQFLPSGVDGPAAVPSPDGAGGLLHLCMYLVL